MDKLASFRVNWVEMSNNCLGRDLWILCLKKQFLTGFKWRFSIFIVIFIEKKAVWSKRDVKRGGFKVTRFFGTHFLAPKSNGVKILVGFFNGGRMWDLTSIGVVFIKSRVYRYVSIIRAKMERPWWTFGSLYLEKKNFSLHFGAYERRIVKNGGFIKKTTFGT